jgi:AraC-like DNA-binding protein
MAMLLENRDLDGLGRLCERPEESGIYAAPDRQGLSRIGAQFYGNAYAPHRHDTYSLGITMHGVQTFSYRGQSHFSMPGNLVILHPDELHDGGAGTDDGLVYRMLYLEPALLRQALGEGALGLPFVADPVVCDPVFRQVLSEGLSDLSICLEELAVDQLLADIATALGRHADAPVRQDNSGIDHPAIERARAFLDDNLEMDVRSTTLESVSGLDRFRLARQFRACFGTSPHRYLLMRRLQKARHLIATEMPLAEIAVETGFSDQSHFNRHFKKAFGMTPGQWAARLQTKKPQTPLFWA